MTINEKTNEITNDYAQLDKIIDQYLELLEQRQALDDALAAIRAEFAETKTT